jgi:hypothetical protein
MKFKKIISMKMYGIENFELIISNHLFKYRFWTRMRIDSERMHVESSQMRVEQSAQSVDSARIPAADMCL